MKCYILPHVHTIKNFENFYSFNGKIGKKTLFNEYIIPFEKCPIYIAHYTNQSKETFIKRKVIKPRDDTGGYRTENNKDITINIHEEYNTIDNFQPKNIYHEKVQRFLKEKEEKKTTSAILVP
jgi:hypothetical protein